MHWLEALDEVRVSTESKDADLDAGLPCGGSLRFARLTGVLWLSQGYEQLIVRDFYSQLYEDTLGRMLPCPPYERMIRQGMTTPRARRALIKGTAGVGKTSFALYVL